MPSAKSGKTTGKAKAHTKRKRVDLDASDTDGFTDDEETKQVDVTAMILTRMENLENKVDKVLTHTEASAKELNSIDDKMVKIKNAALTALKDDFDELGKEITKETEQNDKAWSETIRSVEAIEKTLSEKKGEKETTVAADQIQFMQKVNNLCQSMTKMEEAIESTGKQLKDIVKFFVCLFRLVGMYSFFIYISCKCKLCIDYTNIAKKS